METDGTSRKKLNIEGRVSSGLGRGAQFLGIEWVQRELREKLGLNPYSGTLNLRVTAADWSDLYGRRENFVKIADPQSDNCPGYLQRVALRANGLICPSAFVILPELSMYKDVLEIIAEGNLREMLRLKDGDRILVEEFREP